MSVQLLAIDAATYRPHPLHDDERDWSETNCYTDLWIELLHALGTEPLAMAPFTLAADFEGTQWSFFKPPLEDLFDVYGISVGEMNVWRPVIEHVVEELGLGRLLTVEVDAWYLPDTAGTSYRTEHVKTSIVPQLVDGPGRRIGYFHARGYHELASEDFDGVTAVPVLPPYVELVRLPDRLPDEDELVEGSLRCLRRHVALLPATNPIARMAERIAVELPGLGDPGRYHLYAFATLRQCGAAAEMGATYLDWLGPRIGQDLGGTAGRFREVSAGAKSAQFLLARAARGRTVDLAGPLGAMAGHWAAATAEVAILAGASAPA